MEKRRKNMKKKTQKKGMDEQQLYAQMYASPVRKITIVTTEKIML